MPKGKKNSRGRVKEGRGKETAGSELGWLEANSGAYPNADIVRFRDDRHMRPTDIRITQSVPRNFASMPFWTQQSYEGSYAVAGSSTFAETNFFFALNLFSGYGNMTAIFDQYCIHSVVVNFMGRQTVNVGPYSLGFFTTAIDFDNTTPLGSIGPLQEYSSAQTVELVSGLTCVQRAVQPCVAPALYNTGGLFNAYGVARMWVDSASPSTQHYGIRSAYSLTAGATIGFTVDYTVTAIIGLRNKH